MSSTSSIENVNSPINWVEGALIVIKESGLKNSYSKVVEFVKKYLEQNQKTAKDLFECLNNKNSKRSIDHVLIGFSLEHGIGTIPNPIKAFIEFQKAANAKDSFGQFFLGRCYENGSGTKKNLEKAFQLYSKAAEAGNTNAQVNLGVCYQNGLGTTKKLEKRFQLYSKAAEAGNTNAQFNLGVCYQNGEGTTKKLEKAFQLYSKAAEAGNTNAQVNLGVCYQNGLGTTKNLEKAFQLYSKAAEAGNTNAQFNLGVCYKNGSGTTKNLEKAFQLYSKAAEAGNTNAQVNLGVCYQNGSGTTKNLEKAFQLYSKAAEAGNTNAQYNLGVCYQNGEGTTKNLEKAFQLYSKAAEAGNTKAQYNLGLCYQNGSGTTKNLEKAFQLYSKAVEAGSLVAQNILSTYFPNGLETMNHLEKVINLSPQNNIGMYYRNGWGTGKNLAAAFEFYLKATKMGNQNVQYNLGWCYQNGWGTTKNLEKAFEIYSKAGETINLIYQSDFPDLNALDLTVQDQNDLERFILQFQIRGLKYQRNSKGEFLDFEAFFDQLSDEFKCLKCGNMAFQLYSKAAEAGNTKAQYNLGWCYQNGSGTTKNLEKAFQLYSKAAEAGDTNAQYNLGVCYLNGEGTTKNSEKAFQLYSKAAEAGNTKAQYNLGWCYQNGSGTTKNLEKAFQLYSKAVEAGSLVAQNILSTYFPNGLETMNHLEKVINLSPQNNIGMYYRNGWGTRKNLAAAFEFYLKATKMGNQNCYQNGWGTTKNLEKAFEIYSKAGETINLIYQSDFPDLNSLDLTVQDQNDLERFILQFQIRGLKYQRNSKGEFLDFEAFFDQLSDEFKCLKCGNMGIIIGGSPICPFCDADKSNDNVFEAGLPKCPECYRTLKDPLWCKSCESSRLSKMQGTWNIVIADLGFCRPADYSPRSCNIYGVLEYLAPEICKGASHTKYSDIYSFAVISCEIISGERPLHNTEPIYVRFDVIDGKRPTIKKHTPQCIQEMIEKNWHCTVTPQKNFNKPLLLHAIIALILKRDKMLFEIRQDIEAD
ncbi:hypothetical protein G9A89_010601 [Geosiphon pyriformis]|nr:hypothetical protein G9A89_010601 [Geosiphon pyriformis]